MHTYQSITDGRIFNGNPEGDHIRDISTGHLYPYCNTILLDAPVPAGANPLFVFLGILFWIFLLGPGFVVVWLALRWFKVGWRESGQLILSLLGLLFFAQIVGLAFDWYGPWKLAVWYYENLVLPFWFVVFSSVEQVKRWLGL